MAQAPFGDVFYQSVGTDTSVDVSGIPLNGKPLYVRLWSMADGTWYFEDYVYQTEAHQAQND